MKACKIALLFCILTGAFVWSADVWSAEKEAKVLRMGYAMKTLYDIDMKDAHTAFSMWSGEIGTQTGSVVTLTMFDNVKVLMSNYHI